MLKRVLLTICLEGLVSACSLIPPAPQIVQYGAFPKVTPPGFYGVDSITKERHYHPFTDETMNGAQCLTKPDYSAYMKWISDVKLIAQQRCVCR